MAAIDCCRLGSSSVRGSRWRSSHFCSVSRDEQRDQQPEGGRQDRAERDRDVADAEAEGEMPRGVEEITRGDLPGSDDQDQCAQDQEQTDAAGDEARDQSKPPRADAEIGRHRAAARGAGAEPLDEQSVGEDEQQVERAQHRERRQHPLGDERGKSRIAGHQRDHHHGQHQPADGPDPQRARQRLVLEVRARVGARTTAAARAARRPPARTPCWW